MGLRQRERRNRVCLWRMAHSILETLDVAFRLSAVYYTFIFRFLAIRALRLCVLLQYASFYWRLQSFQCCFEPCFRQFWSLFESISIHYRTLEPNYFVFETFLSSAFLAPVSRRQGPLDSHYYTCSYLRKMWSFQNTLPCMYKCSFQVY